MTLFLDTTGFENVRFVLIDELGDKVIKEKSFQLGYRDSNKVVGLLGKFLPKKILQDKSLKKIVVVSGPGSFSGIRVGVSASLAFSLVWQIPVFAIEKTEVPENILDITKLKKLKKVNPKFEPVYGAEPNITPAKKKV